MNINRIFVSTLFCAAVGCANHQPAAPSADRADQPAKTAQQLSPEEMEARWLKASTPSEGHKQLKPLVGNWNTKAKMWMTPDAPPQESKGTASHQWVLGGRFIKEDYKGSFHGKPFQGVGLLGYDNTQERFVNTWTDSMSTGIMVSEGKYDSEKKELRMTGEYTCPMTGETRAPLLVTRIESDKKHVFEMYEKDENGKEYKALEITYTRKS